MMNGIHLSLLKFLIWIVAFIITAELILWYQTPKTGQYTEELTMSQRNPLINLVLCGINFLTIAFGLKTGIKLHGLMEQQNVDLNSEKLKEVKQNG